MEGRANSAARLLRAIALVAAALAAGALACFIAPIWVAVVVAALCLCRLAGSAIPVLLAAIGVVFATTAGVSVIKMVVVVAMLAVAINVGFARTAAKALDRQLATSALLLLAAAGFGAIVGVASGAAVVDVARDSLTYLVLAMAVPVGAGLGVRVAGPTRAGVVLLVLSGMSAAAFFVTIGAQRGIISTPGGASFLPSLALIAAGYSWCLSNAIERRAPVLHVSMAVVLFALVLASGTRTSLVLLVGLIPVLIRLTRTPVRGAILACSAMGASYLVLQLAALAVGASGLSIIIARLESVGDVFERGLQTDASGAARSQSYGLAQQYFADSPLLGQGLGVISSRADGQRTADASYYLDSPLLLPAKFGIVGTGVILIAIVLILLTTLRTEDRRIRLFVTIWSLILVALIPFGAVTEDKGLALAIAVTAAIATASKNRFARMDDRAYSILEK